MSIILICCGIVNFGCAWHFFIILFLIIPHLAFVIRDFAIKKIEFVCIYFRINQLVVYFIVIFHHDRLNPLILMGLCGHIIWRVQEDIAQLRFLVHVFLTLFWFTQPTSPHFWRKILLILVLQIKIPSHQGSCLGFNLTPSHYITLNSSVPSFTSIFTQ